MEHRGSCWARQVLAVSGKAEAGEEEDEAGREEGPPVGQVTSCARTP